MAEPLRELSRSLIDTQSRTQQCNERQSQGAEAIVLGVVRGKDSVCWMLDAGRGVELWSCGSGSSDDGCVIALY